MKEKRAEIATKVTDKIQTASAKSTDAVKKLLDPLKVVGSKVDAIADDINKRSADALAGVIRSFWAVLKISKMATCWHRD
ncbi:MAG: hypothetical protein ACI8WB_004519 [Phenylobacterium sp.]|jgi:hypothetical protein